MANKLAVQYHFGDRQRLIRLVFERRLPAVDASRKEMVAELAARGAPHETLTLFEITIRPIAEIADAGHHPYAAFLLAVYQSEHNWVFRIKSREYAPFTVGFRKLLRQTVPHLPRREFNKRYHLAVLVFLDMIVRADEDGSRSQPRRKAERIIRDATFLGGPILIALVAKATSRSNWSSFCTPP